MQSIGKFLVFILLTVKHQISSLEYNVSIKPPNLTLNEGSNGTVKCSYDGQDKIQGVIFKINGSKIASIQTINCTFNIVGLKNYKTNCEGNKTFILTMLNVSRTEHGKFVQCSLRNETGNEIFSKEKTSLYVNVPLERILITSSYTDSGQITECENVTINLTCTTSPTRPASNITWLYHNNDKNVVKEVTDLRDQGIKTSLEEDKNLFRRISTLTFKTEKLLNSGFIFCSSSFNLPSVVNSSNMTFDILYPPEQFPTISNVNISNGDTYRIIEGRKGEIDCSIRMSKPNANLTWTGLQYSQKLENHLEFITTKLEWNASRNGTNSFTCIASHDCNNFNRSISLSTQVLYPPKVNPMENVSIVEGSLLKITCNFTPGIPDNVTIKWTRHTDILIEESKILSITNISRNFSSDYACIVANIMKPTIGNKEIGESKEIVYVDVLYPPTIDPIQNQSTTERNDFNKSCPVHQGNPETSNITWTSSNKSIHITTQILSLKNISKSQAALYTCTVFYNMYPTNNVSVKGNISESFYLTVEYEATITSFFVNENSDGSNITLNENENVTFHCHVDSVPPSTTYINFQNDSTLKSYGSTNKVSYHLGQATCLDAGSYKCNGHNEHNMEIANKELFLFVNCSPRAHPRIDISKVIPTELNVPLVLNFSAVAYPLPTTVNWQKLQGSNWTIVLTYSNDILMSYSDLNFNLTIQNVHEEDLGKYKLVIINDIGKLEQNFTIIAADKPNPPSKFQVLKKNISASSITVGWFSSFNGGQRQHFVLNISKNDEEKWKSEIVRDSKDTSFFSHTFNGLSSGIYYKFNIYAENKIGRSNISDTLLYRTREKYVKTNPQVGNTLTIVIGVVIGFISALAGMVIVICFYKKRMQKAPDKSVYQNVPFSGKSTKSNTKKMNNNSISKETNVDEFVLQEVDDVPNLLHERTEYYNSVEKIGQIDRINILELFQYVIGKDEDEFAIEYQKIPTELQKPCIFARKPENIALNRYNGIFPYDHSRVKIPALPDFFMNACYIDGFQKQRAYIASLGPTEKTTNKFVTFWQMVWYERSDIIVMLTNLRELSGMKCEQYWPERGSLTYGEISVSCLEKEIFAEYTVRRFTMSKDKEQQSVTHLHYTAWPDKTVPEDVTSLLEFRQRMITTPTTSKGPIIVHCSAGIGRTGTLIAIDRLVAEGQHRKSVDVFKCVKSMREQRVKMVQTLEQYIFVYKALVNALAFENESVTFKDLQTNVDEPRSSKYSRQFQQLKQTVEKEKKEEKEARYRNEKQTSKNRTGADIPGDRFRIFLNLDKEDDSNYINAAYVNSFKRRDIFITSQTPLQNTVKDFINMVYQENCICIVTMDDLNESEKTVGKYVTDSNRKTFGNFNVSSSILERKHQYILREMKIKYDGKYQRGEKSVYHFQYTQWLEENETPENAEDFVTFIKEVQQYANEFGDETSHILVHCLNAYERSSLFCVVSAIMEKLQYEKRASITNTVRHIRTRRRSAIKSKEQLVFCYTAAGAFTRLHDS